MAILRHRQRAITAVTPAPGQGAWINPSKGGYRMPLVYFDNTVEDTTYLERLSSLIAFPDSDTFTLSLWVDFVSGLGVQRGLVCGDTTESECTSISTGGFVQQVNRNDISQLAINQTGNLTALAGPIHHIWVAADRNGGSSILDVYVDGQPDVSISSWNVESNPLAFSSVARWFIGRHTVANRSSNANFGDIWFSNLYLKYSTEGSKFAINNKPVYLGERGEIPTGFIPSVFFSGTADEWTGPGNNRGTGGDFTVTGTLTDAGVI